MATIETPPQIAPPEPSVPPNRQPKDGRERRPLSFRKEDMTEEDFHFLISELRDENSRSRMREAVWISIIVHMVILFVLKESPRIWPHAAVTVVSPSELMKNQHLTYLDQRPDTQRVPKVESNKISDKDRRAMARNPQLRKLLDELRDNRRTGAPAQQQPQQQAQMEPQPQAPPQQQPQQQASQQPRISQNQQSTPQAQPNPFANYQRSSASSAIQNAARAAASGRGQGGEYGNGVADPSTPVQGNLDILSDTQGVDFGPYLQRVLHDVKVNWYAIMPPQVYPPLRKQGKLAIQFTINKNGQVEDMHLVAPSGDTSLDRAAWGGITGSNPFPPLPREFQGENLVLRFRFYYNPDRGEELR
jgi:TonB family protein